MVGSVLYGYCYKFPLWCGPRHGVPSLFNPISHFTSPMNGLNEQITRNVKKKILNHGLQPTKADQFWMGCVSLWKATWCKLKQSWEVTKWREGCTIVALPSYTCGINSNNFGIKQRCHYLGLSHIGLLVLDTYGVWPTWKWSNIIIDVSGNNKVFSSCLLEMMSG